MALGDISSAIRIDPVDVLDVQSCFVCQENWMDVA